MAQNKEIKNEVKEEVKEVKTEQVATTSENLPAEKQSFSDKHPKIAAVGAKAKKAGKWIGLGAAVVGGLFVANKIGEAKGFDKAYDAFNSNNGNNDDDNSKDSEELQDDYPEVVIDGEVIEL